MSIVEAGDERLVSQEQENGMGEILKVRVNGDANDAADILRALQARLIRPIDYSITPGVLHGTMEIVLIIPPRSERLRLIHQCTDPMELLQRNPSVLSIEDVQHVTRRHIRIVTNTNHPDVLAFNAAIQQLGGSIQGRLRNKVKLTADMEVHAEVMSCLRGMSAIAQNGRANSPFTTAEFDVPHHAIVDVTQNPDFAPEALRHVLRIRCWPGLHHDTEIVAILQRYGFHISSIGSRSCEDNPGEQELTLKIQNGNDSLLQRALSDITILSGVLHVERLPSIDTSQYVQAVFPMSRTHDLRSFLRTHTGLHIRNRMTPDQQMVISGSLPLAEAAAVQRDLVMGDIGWRPNPAISNTVGPRIAGSDIPWDPEDDVFWRELRNTMLRSLTDLVKRKGNARNANPSDL